MMETHVSESLALRVQKMESIKGAGEVGVYRDILDVYVYDVADIARGKKKMCMAPYIPLLLPKKPGPD